MTNTNIQSFVQLAGKGHTYRKNGGYTAGEYKQLVNAELNDLGYIVSRRNIVQCNHTESHDGSGALDYSNLREFVGHIGRSAVVTQNMGKILHFEGGGTLRTEGWDTSGIRS